MTAHEETHDSSHTGREAPDRWESGDGKSASEAQAAEPAGTVAGAELGRHKFSAWALGGGTEPDARFTLANERTFLAWIRTSLAMVAGGIAVEAFTSGLLGPELRKTVAVLLLLLGLVTAGGAFFRWLNVERAMRHQTPLPAPLLAPILAAGGCLVAAVLIVFVIGRPA
jgi:putative membrane protein